MVIGCLQLSDVSVIYRVVNPQILICPPMRTGRDPEYEVRRKKVAYETKTYNKSRVHSDHPRRSNAMWMCTCGHTRDIVTESILQVSSKSVQEFQSRRWSKLGHSHYFGYWLLWMNEWKCEDFKCVWKPTESRLCLTHYVNKSSRWAK